MKEKIIIFSIVGALALIILFGTWWIIWFLYSVCLTPLGFPVLGYWQMAGITILLGFISGLFRAKVSVVKK